MPTETSTKVIKIAVKDESSRPIERVAKQFKKLNGEVKKTSRSMQTMSGFVGKLKGLFVGMIAAMGVREIIRSADAFQLVKDRIRALWGEGVDAEVTLRKVYQVAQDTNAPLETLADGFARISLSAKGMGLSVDETARGVKSLQQTLRLSGASVAEVNSVYLQFSQAMGLSRLQGQELRAVMLGNAKLAGMLAEEFNTTRGALRDLGEKGLLDTARIFRMLIREGVVLDKQAAKLKVTFGQAMIKAFDSFRVRVDRLNAAIGGSQGFSETVNKLTKNMDALFSVIMGAVAAGIFYKLAAGIQAAYVAFTAWMVKTGVAVLAFKAAAVAIIALAAAYAALQVYLVMQEKISTKSITKQLALNKLEEEWLAKKEEVRKKQSQINTLKGSGYDTSQRLAEMQILKVEITAAERKFKLAQKQYNLDIKNKKKKSGSDTVNKITDIQKLNATLDERNKITKTYLLLSMSMQMAELDKKFEKHKINGLEYNKQLIKINDEHRKMLLEMEAIENKDNIFYGIQQGAEATLKSIGTLAEEISKVTTQAFSHLEDNLVDFVKTGRFEFAKFAQAIMDDITRMVIRMSIIKPLASAISGGFSGSGGGGNNGDPNGVYTQAMGGAWRNGKVIPFATGGVVTRPTTFGMSGGRTGLMGEKGAEAILPLSRGSNGKLGVQGSGTTVNVINNSSAETETKESTNSDGSKQIDVYIVNKVGEAIGEGRFDRSFQQLYGMQRRGN